VQRVPVRIALEPREIAAHPLQIGLSMKVDVEVRGGSEARLPQLASDAAGWSTNVFASSDGLADRRVQAIIAANQSAPAARPAVGRLTANPAAGDLLASTQPHAAAPRHLH